MSKCRSCGAEIVWLETLKGKQMPVDADKMKPGFTIWSKSLGSHWETCEYASMHRKPKKDFLPKEGEGE